MSCEFCIGDYVINMIHGEIGRGAFGSVYEGKHKTENYSAAVKRIRTNNDSEIEDAKKEIKNLQQIPRHKNIVHLLDYHFTTNSRSPCCWLFMEFCDRGNLEQFVTRENPAFTTKANFMLQSATGLNYLHSLKEPVVHRDIKPANILLKADGNEKLTVKLTDFGVAKIGKLQSMKATTLVMETFLGTPAFIAPELIARMAYTKSIDVFSLGLVFLSMLVYKKGDKYLIPRIENCIGCTTVGDEMHKAHITGQPQPILTSDADSDNPLQLGIKQLIRDMCCFVHTDRLRIHEVTKRLEKLLTLGADMVPVQAQTNIPENKENAGLELLDEATGSADVKVRDEDDRRDASVFRFTELKESFDLEDSDTSNEFSADDGFKSTSLVDCQITQNRGPEGKSSDEVMETTLPESGMFDICMHGLESNFCIGDYVIDYIAGERGTGYFGTVFEGRHKTDNTSVAVKRLRADNDQEEADIMIKLRIFDRIPRHINIVYISEFHYKSPFYWVVMEYCDLGDLQQYVIRENPPLSTKVEIMVQAATGLNHLHSLKKPVVHRDVKPANIMLKTDELGKLAVKIAESYLVKMANVEFFDRDTVIMETQCGTPGFMAPEFFAGMVYTQSVDVFALGLVFLSLVNYRSGDKHLLPLIEGSREMRAVGDVMHKAHITGLPNPTLISDADSDNPLELGIKQLIRDMCCFYPTHRPRMPKVVKRLHQLQLRKLEELKLTGDGN